jgi:transcriptional regulator with XRE-family HTH domain
MGKVRRTASRGKRRGLGHIDDAVGARVRQFRLRKGLSQTTLADALGITFQQVQKYEKGTNAIATARLPMLCDVLGIAPNDLYGDLFKRRRGNNLPAPQLDTVTVKAAIMMDRISPRVRSSIFKLIADLAGEGPLDEES